MDAAIVLLVKLVGRPYRSVWWILIRPRTDENLIKICLLKCTRRCVVAQRHFTPNWMIRQDPFWTHQWSCAYPKYLQVWRSFEWYEGPVAKERTNIGFLALRGNSKTECSIRHNFELDRDFMHVLVIRKLDKVLIQKKLLWPGWHYLRD